MKNLFGKLFGGQQPAPEAGGSVVPQSPVVQGTPSGKWEKGEVILDEFVVEGVLGQGGMGTVFLLRNRSTQAAFAVKRVAGMTEQNQRKFLAEVQTWIDLPEHPNLAACRFFRMVGDVVMIFADHVEGRCLSSWIGTRKLYEGGPQVPLKRMLDMAIQSALGLGYLHERGLVHRDVKPANILLEAGQQAASGVRAKVTDIGLARAKVAGGDFYSPGSEIVMNVLVSSDGYTPAYCSPEQGAGKPVTKRTDVWSWGLSVLEMFTGKITWASGVGASEALASYLKSGGPNGIPAMPDKVARLLEGCFQRDEAQRIGDLSEAVERLTEAYQEAIGVEYGPVAGGAGRRRVAEPKRQEPMAEEPPAVNNEPEGKDEAAVQPDRQTPGEPAEVMQTEEAKVALEWKVGDVILDTYEVKQIHEGGGMGLVYRVCHRDWKEDLAVKSPRPEFFSSQAHKENFVRECITWIGLGLYPHIVTCYYVRLLGGIPRVFAEYVEGGTLKEWIETRRLYRGGHEQALARMLDVAIQFAWGLHYGHEKEVIHQDVKPANVMVTPEGVVKLTDFGLAKARATTGESAMRTSQRSILVSTGGMTPAYCSPEQAAKAPLTRRTDIWSWGLAVLEMFAGEMFWSSGTAAPEALDAYLQNGTEEDVIPKMPDGLADLLRACFQKTPEQRPKDLEWVVERLKAIHQSALARAYAREEGREVEATADVLTNQGVSYYDLGLESEAGKRFEQALVADPHHVEATYNRGLLLWRACKTTDDIVLKQLEEAGKSHPGDPTANYLISLLHLERGDAESAVKVLSAIRERATHVLEIQRALKKAQDCLGTGGQHLRTFEGHASAVTSVTITPNGRWGLSGSGSYFNEIRGCNLRLWDVATGRCLRTFEGHTSEVTSVAISPDGRWGLSGSDDKTLRLWDLASGQCLRTFEGHTNDVTSVAITPDGRWGLSGSDDKTLRLWDLTSGQCLRTFEGHTNDVTSVAITPDGRWGLSGSDDKTLRLWDLTSGQCLRTFEGHTSNVQSVAITPDGLWGLSGGGFSSGESMDFNLRLWDLLNGRCLRMFEGHSSWVNSVAISPDGHRGLSGSADDTLRLWDLASGQCLRTFEGHTHSVCCIAISPDGRWGLTGSYDKTLRLWSVTLPDVHNGIVHTKPQQAKELLHQHDQFMGELAKAEAHLHRGKMDAAIGCLDKARAIPGNERNGKAMLLVGRVAGHCRGNAFRGAWQLRSFGGHADYVSSVAITPDGRWGLSGSGDKTLRLWDLASGQCLRTFEGHTDTVSSISISLDGRWGLSGSFDKTLRLWDLESGHCLRTLDEPTAGVKTVAFSPDARWALSGGLSPLELLRLWDLASGQCLRTFEEAHCGWVPSVAFSPDGRWALSGTDDTTLPLWVRLWDLASGQCLRTFEGHRGLVNSVAFSPNGHWALSGSSDRTLRLWDLASGECLRTFDGHTAGVATVAFSPNGHWALSGSSDRTLRLWDLASGECLRTFDGHTAGVATVAFSPDARWALSGSIDTTLRLWQLDWEYEFPGWADWNEGARSYLTTFLTLHCPIGPDGFTRTGKPAWNEADFQRLISDLQNRGYGWLRPEGVRRELEKMAKQWQGPPSFSRT